MKDGILNINKPQDMTSFDVVAILRKVLGVKRIGHLGTLDPMAEGVLPIAIGKAARVMDYLDSDTKEYVAEFVFGITSDTDDIWGENITLSDSFKEISREDIEEAAKVFIGVIEQIPPRYAAIKVDGRKLYEYARAGQEVDVKSRKIEIASFDVLDFGKRYVEEVQADLFYTVVKVVCSKGTYIRSLARDLGNILGAGGAMSALVRRRSGALKIEDAISVETIRNMEIGEIEGFIKGAEEVLTGFPSVMLGEWESRLFRNGVKLEASQWHNENAGSELYKVFGPDGFIGVGREYDDGTLKADKVLA